MTDGLRTLQGAYGHYIHRKSLITEILCQCNVPIFRAVLGFDLWTCLGQSMRFTPHHILIPQGLRTLHKFKAIVIHNISAWKMSILNCRSSSYGLWLIIYQVAKQKKHNIYTCVIYYNWYCSLITMNGKINQNYNKFNIFPSVIQLKKIMWHILLHTWKLKIKYMLYYKTQY